VHLKTKAARKTDAGADRRVEERLRAEGEVEIWFDDPEPQELRGRLLDYSRGGFRALHGLAQLATGQVVRFRHFGADGRARVIWKRILNDEVETGFFVL
jgi:hypothetical protein